MLIPCGMTVALAVDSTVYVCVPITLFSNRSLTPIPPSDKAPCNVMVGPGELLQPEVDIDVWTLTGVSKVALTVVAACATESRPRQTRTIEAPNSFFIRFSHAQYLTLLFHPTSLNICLRNTRDAVENTKEHN